MDIELITAVAPGVASYFWATKYNMTRVIGAWMLEWAMEMSNHADIPDVSSLSCACRSSQRRARVLVCVCTSSTAAAFRWPSRVQCHQPGVPMWECVLPACQHGDGQTVCTGVIRHCLCSRRRRDFWYVAHGRYQLPLLLVMTRGTVSDGHGSHDCGIHPVYPGAPPGCVLAGSANSQALNRCAPATSPWVTAVGSTLPSPQAAPRCNSKLGEVAASIPTGITWTTGGGFSSMPANAQPEWQAQAVERYVHSASKFPPSHFFNASRRACACARRCGSWLVFLLKAGVGGCGRRSGCVHGRQQLSCHHAWLPRATRRWHQQQHAGVRRCHHVAQSSSRCGGQGTGVRNGTLLIPCSACCAHESAGCLNVCACTCVGMWAPACQSRLGFLNPLLYKLASKYPGGGFTWRWRVSAFPHTVPSPQCSMMLLVRSQLLTSQLPTTGYVDFECFVVCRGVGFVRRCVAVRCCVCAGVCVFVCLRLGVHRVGQRVETGVAQRYVVRSATKPPWDLTL